MTLKKFGTISTVAGGVVFLWYVVTSTHAVDPLFVPSPSSVYASFRTLSETGVWLHVLVTSLRVFCAVLLSFGIAIPLSLLMYWNPRIRIGVSPIVDFIRYLPVPALVPLLILFFGIGELSKIAILFIGTFFQVILLLLDFLKNIPQEYYELGYVFHFRTFALFRMQVRAILPELWDTLRISIGWCWTYVIIAELVATEAGIGRVIKEAQRFSDSSKLYATLIIVGLTGLAVDQGMKKLAPRLFRYRCTQEGAV